MVVGVSSTVKSVDVNVKKSPMVALVYSDCAQLCALACLLEGWSRI